LGAHTSSEAAPNSDVHVKEGGRQCEPIVVLVLGHFDRRDVRRELADQPLIVHLEVWIGIGSANFTADWPGRRPISIWAAAVGTLKEKLLNRLDRDEGWFPTATERMVACTRKDHTKWAEHYQD